MTDSCSYFSMWRVFDTLSSRGFAIPTLRSRWSLSMGLLRFSLSEAVKNQSFIKLEPMELGSMDRAHRNEGVFEVGASYDVNGYSPDMEFGEMINNIRV